MKSIIESLAKDEQAILIVALFLLIYVVIMINVMVREYRTYLDDPRCIISAWVISSGEGVSISASSSAWCLSRSWVW